MRIAYYLLLKPLSYLPLSVLYVISNPFHLVITHIIRYRRQTVLQQLRTCFPAKEEREIRQISRRFYRHFVDLLMESLRMFSMPKKEILQRYRVTNPEVFETARQKRQHIALVASHYNNWEMACCGIQLYVQNDVFGIYSPLTNAFMDGRLREARERFGIRMVSKRGLHQFFLKKDSHASTVLIFAADQSPRARSSKHWIDFLGQPTAFMTGTERYAKKYNLPVYYMFMKKVKRGHYEATFKLLSDEPQSLPEGCVTLLHTRELEKEILEDPAHWLWSHKRWKKKKGADEPMITCPTLDPKETKTSTIKSAQ